MLRLAHFSDFHLRNRGSAFDCAVAMAGDASAQDADHLAITGDLVDAAEIGVLTAYFEELELLGWSLSKNVSFVPGNHDVFPWRKGFPPINWSNPRPTSNWNDIWRLTVRTRGASRCIRLARNEPYPYGRIVSDQVVLVGLDTTRNGQYTPLQHAEGELPECQMKAAADFFAAHGEKPHRILAMHHSPFNERFQHEELISQSFADPAPAEVMGWLKGCGATLVLCGHVHTIRSIKNVAITRKCRLIRAGISGGYHEDEPECDRIRGYHLIDLNPNGKVTVVRRLFTGRELASF